MEHFGLQAMGVEEPSPPLVPPACVCLYCARRCFRFKALVLLLWLLLRLFREPTCVDEDESPFLICIELRRDGLEKRGFE